MRWVAKSLPSSELPTRATKRFFETVFEWSFVDYGPDYSSFSNQGLDGVLFKSELASTSENGAALIVFTAKNWGLLR